MDELKFKNGDELLITYPYDQGYFWHPIEVHTFSRREDEETKKTKIDLYTGEVEESTLDNPSSRRQAISIIMRSEEELYCRLDISQHKGTTTINWNDVLK